MATIKELVAKEKERPDIASCRVVHLHKEGQFLGAYEWSAGTVGQVSVLLA